MGTRLLAVQIAREAVAELLVMTKETGKMGKMDLVVHMVEMVVPVDKLLIIHSEAMEEMVSSAILLLDGQVKAIMV